jgi:uncharacterized repeat protein (TIGR01451 family)
MSQPSTLRVRRVLGIALILALVLAVSLVGIAAAATSSGCVTNSYAVTFSAPPPSANWTDTSGAVWLPAGGFPGCAPGDTAADTSFSPTTLIVNSVIPNTLAGVNLGCSGCVIDIQAGGQLAIAGSATVASGASIVVNGGTLIADNLTINGSVTVNNGGLLHFNGGSITGTGSLAVNSGGAFTWDSSSATISGVSVSNAGSMTFSPSSPATLTLGSTIANTNYLEFSNGLTSISAGGTINNGGTLNSAANVVVQSPVNNLAGATGVQVTSGTLGLAGGGTGDAPFAISPGAILDFPASSYTMTTGGVVSGGGTLSVSGGTLSIGGVTEPAYFTLSAGILTGPGFLTVSNYMYWSGGTLTGSGGTQVAGGGAGDFDGSVGGMILDGRTLDIYGMVDYSATTNPLEIDNGGLLNIYGTFTIAADGNITTNDTSSPRLTISPNGTLQKTAGSGTSVIYVPSRNDSTVYVSQGTLEFAGNGTHGGFFFSGSGATLVFSAASTTLNGNAYVTGDGNVSFQSGYTTNDGTIDVFGQLSITNSGTLTNYANVATTDYFMDSGLLELYDDFFLYGDGRWSGGAIDVQSGCSCDLRNRAPKRGISVSPFGPVFDVTDGATLTIDNAADDTTLAYGEMDVESGGTILYTATSNAFVLTGGAGIYNAGLFDIQADAPINQNGISAGLLKLHAAANEANKSATATPPKRRLRPGTKEIVPIGNTYFYNDGTFQKSGLTGTTIFDPELDNAAFVKLLAGDIAFQLYSQNSGSTTLGPGNLTMAGSSPLSLIGGTLDGSGTVTGNVDNSGGTVSPGGSNAIGTITVTGTYDQTGALSVELAGASSYDQLAVGGATTLDGSSTASLISGYTPLNGATFPVLTYASHTGAFVSEALPPGFTSAYTPTAYVLTAVVAPQANLNITKTGPSGVVAGQNVTYTIAVKNNGPSTATNVTVSDPAPANLTFVGNSGACTGTFPCSLGTLTNGATATILSTWSTSPSFSGNVTNTATVSATETDPNTADNSASASTNVGAQADLGVTKNGPTSTNTGQTISYTVAVTNAGPSPAVGTVVSDPTPTGIAFIGNTGGCTTPYPCNLGTLASGQTVTIVSTYTVPGSYSGATISNTATASSTVNDPNPTNDSATATTNVAQQADVSISKSGPAQAGLGQNVTYTLTVTNAGPASAAAVVVNDPAPPGTAFVSNSGGCTSSFPCNLGTMTPGQTVTINATYNIPANYAPPAVTNTATVSSGASDPNSGNNSSTATTAIVAQADLGITKTGPLTASVGTNISYMITVTNNGPLAATNTFVNDPTPAGVTFVSNSGACSGPFPCALGTLASGTTAVITSTYAIPANYSSPTVSNAANVSSSTLDTNTANNAATASTTIAPPGSDLGIAKSGPAQAVLGSVIEYKLDIVNKGPLPAANITVTDPTPSGLSFVSNSGACTTPFPCTIAALPAGNITTVTARYRVTAASSGTTTNVASVSSAANDSDPTNNSSSIQTSLVAAAGCGIQNPPALQTPANGSTVSSPLTLGWTPIEGATGYIVTITGTGAPAPIHTSTNSASVTLPTGTYSWSVQATLANICGPLTSETSTFSICNTFEAPLASVVGESTTGQTYAVRWPIVPGATQYEVQESTELTFASPASFFVDGNIKTFTKQATTPTAFFYRVRAVSPCSTAPFSPVISVVVVPVPGPNDSRINANVPDGSTTPVTFRIFVPGLASGPTAFVASTDKKWLSVLPVSGILPPEGMFLTISEDPSELVNGTWTGTVIIVYGTTSSGKFVANGSTSTSIPVSISLVTPVTPSKLQGATNSALIIPSVGHLIGAGTQWRSDIRLANVAGTSQKYLLTFNPGVADATTSIKQTTLNVLPGDTTALDDVVRSWFGIGSLGDSSNGVLMIQALDASGKVIPNGMMRVTPDEISVNRQTVVSSRTYNVASNAATPGTLGQFVPATAFANFIGRSGTAAASALSLQQIAQNDAYRTNLGLVEAAGKATQLDVSVFDAGGNKLLTVPVSLNAGEQKQLNSFLATNNINLSNGRIEVAVASGDGRVNAYASVIDNKTNDPLLVSGVPLTNLGASHYVLPAIGDLQTGNASWRSDVRLFNAGNAPQNTTLTIYPNGNPSAGVSRDVTVIPGEVKALDSIVPSLFGLSNTSGTLHVTTPTGSPLVVTARSYDQTASGTLGQFIPAVTEGDGVGNGDRALQILQVEDSVHYRTNLGIAELSGKPVVVEVSVVVPESKVSPRVQLTLGAYESRQFPVISELGLSNTYNARVSVRVIDGGGKVTAYGSVVDMTTQAPTYVPAQ